jgi:2-polyprenyl-3-methyl-5-hydroxy-6-metoxy-1,4-benzoquinol methylase
MKNYGASLNQAILPYLLKNQQVLEIGPGEGEMTRYLSEELHCTTTIVEYDRSLAEKAGQWAAHTVIADLEQPLWLENLANTAFDTIILADVLEHLRDPWRVLQQATTLLKPDGQLLISIPNVGHNVVLMHLLQDRFTYQPTGILDNTHLRFFTREGIDDLIAKAGLTPTHLSVNTVAPQHTEMPISYHEFPLCVGWYLARRRYGHVLQFVYRTVLKQSVSSSKLVLHENIPPQRYSFFKLLRRRFRYTLSKR